MNKRSWSKSVGIMLVPSTFTGRYKNRMTSSAMSTERSRSRNHETVERKTDGARCVAAANGTDPSMLAGVAGSLIRSSTRVHAKRASVSGSNLDGHALGMFAQLRVSRLRGCGAYLQQKVLFGAQPILFRRAVRVAAFSPKRVGKSGDHIVRYFRTI